MARHLTLLALAACLCGAARAADLDDPMRPPAAWQGGAAAPEVPAPPVLQSILRRQGARPAALIDGRRVEVGARVGDSRLVAIHESSVELRGAAGRVRLSLTPEVERSLRSPAAPGEQP
ncbi:MAG: hypothetical protein JNJ60_02415 [Rhodocyclaceae bacterium]|nr:hypothetical protein [Rhodocyclaceae bacterium]